jgi:hypothetical protein
MISLLQRCKDLQRSRDAKIQGCKDPRMQRSRDAKIQGSKDLRISGSKEAKISGSKDLRIHNQRATGLCLRALDLKSLPGSVV